MAGASSGSTLSSWMARRIESSSDSIEGSCAVFTLPMPPHFTRITSFSSLEIARIPPQGKLRRIDGQTVIRRNCSIHRVDVGPDPFAANIEIVLLGIVVDDGEPEVPRRHMADRGNELVG